MKQIFIAFVVLAGVVGCQTEDVSIVTTRGWEGHYFTQREFYNATSDIHLEKGESIWVMSNHTLQKILKNQRKED